MEFIHKRLLPSNPQEYRGRATRALNSIIEAYLNHFADEIPFIPERDCCDSYRVQFDATLPPLLLAQVDAIVEHWKGTENHTSRSAVVDHFIDLIRTGSEEADKKHGNAHPKEKA
jgi:hypothetical protein